MKLRKGLMLSRQHSLILKKERVIIVFALKKILVFLIII
jgi:hypothetical protein